MATAQVDEVALSVMYGQQRLALRVKRKDTVADVVKQAAAQLKEPEDKKYMLLYKGSAVSGELKVGVSNANWKKNLTQSSSALQDALAMESVTVVHLAPRIEDHMGRPRTGEQTQADINNHPTSEEKSKALSTSLHASHFLAFFM